MKKITQTLAILCIAILSTTVQSQQVFLFDLNHNNSELNRTEGNWNNHLASAMTTDITNFINDQGVASTYSFGVTDSFVAANNNGTTSPDPSIGFPATATIDSYYVQDGSNETGAFTFSGMNTSMYYQFEIFASRMSVSDNRQAQYTATGANTGIAYLDGGNNTANTTTIANIQPDASGNIVLALQKGPENTNGAGFCYIGVIKMTETTELSTSDFSLEANVTISPNPVAESFSIRFKMNNTAKVSIAMYDVAGKMVTSIFNDEVSAGVFNHTWNRTSGEDDTIAAGLYILEINAGGNKMSKRVVLK
ncbi:T9SS type A sorting domain-containing protein [Gelidibacter pelagius]|uniref:T9SS type A sorting domain-containing protein n=1 Tax=Gelidibacter pelagius TaxID=2819985 RepID=A0ABS3SS64_9FLAO|nr:T9SS type A sorting domain-containing protein [Gelidibacter pelagius]MBO3097777.1 T9SS type A sorting domain-containing protein [Gelidibacter pelagius]